MTVITFRAIVDPKMAAEVLNLSSNNQNGHPKESQGSY